MMMKKNRRGLTLGFGLVLAFGLAAMLLERQVGIPTSFEWSYSPSKTCGYDLRRVYHRNGFA